ncbi:MAG: hypothetical protein LJE96_08050 [Deltaproteobacteria bacterium]|nr:hypothetical protein [Deltaproteobacteria bacterium]
MHDVTLALAVILGSGFFIGKLGQLARLPSVTGYILADVILGSSVLNFVSEETITGKLGHFTQIALMLIAFRIGEHLEISRPKRSLKSVGLIAISLIPWHPSSPSQTDQGAFWRCAKRFFHGCGRMGGQKGGEFERISRENVESESTAARRRLP